MTQPISSPPILSLPNESIIVAKRGADLTITYPQMAQGIQGNIQPNEETRLLSERVVTYQIATTEDSEGSYSCSFGDVIGTVGSVAAVALCICIGINIR